MISALGLMDVVIPPQARPGRNTFSPYVARVKDRNALQSHLSQLGIQTAVYYPIPLHLQPSLSFLGCGPGDFPCAEAACEEVLALPSFPGLTPGEQERVLSALADYYHTEQRRPSCES